MRARVRRSRGQPREPHARRHGVRVLQRRFGRGAVVHREVRLGLPETRVRRVGDATDSVPRVRDRAPAVGIVPVLLGLELGLDHRHVARQTATPPSVRDPAVEHLRELGRGLRIRRDRRADHHEHRTGVRARTEHDCGIDLPPRDFDRAVHVTGPRVDPRVHHRVLEEPGRVIVRGTEGAGEREMLTRVVVATASGIHRRVAEPRPHTVHSFDVDRVRLADLFLHLGPTPELVQ